MPDSSASLLHRPTVSANPVAVVAAADTLHLMATRPFTAGDEILWLEGQVVEAPTRYTVQIGAQTHLDTATGLDEREKLSRCPWLFLNHACEPNTRLGGEDGRSLIALTEIDPGDELTFDYESNEACMAEPFICACGACGGRLVRGFGYLTPEERAERVERISSHLVK